MVQYFDWLPQVEALKNVDSIENELALFQFSDIKQDIAAYVPAVENIMCDPHKFDFFMFIKHIAGSAILKIDMEEYALSEPVNSIKLAPGQIVSIEQSSEDFDAIVILMSKRFVENLMVYMNGTIPFRFGKNVSVIEHCSVEEDYFTNIILALYAVSFRIRIILIACMLFNMSLWLYFTLRQRCVMPWRMSPLAPMQIF